MTGRVTFGGQPVKEGHIAFDPVTPGKGGGFAKILDGAYDTRKEGRTHSGGKHRITISGYKGLKDPKNPDSDIIMLFPTYRTESDLPRHLSTLDFEVPTKRE